MFIERLWKDPTTYWATIITIVISITLHELAHGLVAIWRGDRTPITNGRMTLSPLVHMGPFSLLVMFISGIAWGQMPIDPTRMRGKYAEAIVALAGPLMNVLLGVLALTGLGLWQRFDARPTVELSMLLQNLTMLVGIFGIVNIHLALFNLIPIPPLDGYHVLANFNHGYAVAMRSFMMSGGAILGLLIVFSLSGQWIAPVAVKVSVSYLNLLRRPNVTLQERPRSAPLPQRRFGDDARGPSLPPPEDQPATLAMTASATCVVLAVPPRSRV